MTSPFLPRLACLPVFHPSRACFQPPPFKPVFRSSSSCLPRLLLVDSLAIIHRCIPHSMPHPCITSFCLRATQSASIGRECMHLCTRYQACPANCGVFASVKRAEHGRSALNNSILEVQRIGLKIVLMVVRSRQPSAARSAALPCRVHLVCCQAAFKRQHLVMAPARDGRRACDRPPPRRHTRTRLQSVHCGRQSDSGRADGRLRKSSKGSTVLSKRQPTLPSPPLAHAPSAGQAWRKRHHAAACCRCLQT